MINDKLILWTLRVIGLSFIISRFRTIGLSFIIFHLSFSPAGAQTLSFVELNCENLFDTMHDEGKQDEEYLPDATRHWTKKRYWRKLNNIAQALLSTTAPDTDNPADSFPGKSVSRNGIPDLIALCEVENDSVLHDLTRRSLLRNAGYEYLMTRSPDLRGIDVALLYSPFSFRPLTSYPLRVTPVEGMRPTRDILYVSGLVRSSAKTTGHSADRAGGAGIQRPGQDTLHIFVVHAPSRYGGERHSRPFRLAVADRLCQSLDSIISLSPDANILIAGDFNDDASSPALRRIYSHGVRNVSAQAKGLHGVRGTYRYKGEWGSLDHILVSRPVAERVDTVFIHSPRFLLEEDRIYGGYHPRRTYNGMRYQPGYSDHLPLVIFIAN